MTQTILQKQNAWADFFRRKNPNSKVLDSLSNWQVVEGHLEHKKLPWTAENINEAIKSNVDYIEFDRSAEVIAQQQAQRAARKAETEAINTWLAEARSTYGFADTDRNAKLLSAFLLREHGGKFSKVAADHFIRTYSGSSEADWLAQPASQVESPEAMWSRQNVLRNPAQEREERLAAAAERKKQFDADMNSAKTRATFIGEMQAIKSYREVTARGISWSQTWSTQRDRMTALLSKYPALT